MLKLRSYTMLACGPDATCATWKRYPILSIQPAVIASRCYTHLRFDCADEDLEVLLETESSVVVVVEDLEKDSSPARIFCSWFPSLIICCVR